MGRGRKKATCSLHCDGCNKCSPRGNSNYWGGFGQGDSNNDGRRTTAPVYATMDGGHEVTVAFGVDKTDGHTYISDNHVEAPEQFWTDEQGERGHAHYYGDGDGDPRGKYTGPGA